MLMLSEQPWVICRTRDDILHNNQEPKARSATKQAVTGRYCMSYYKVLEESIQGTNGMLWLIVPTGCYVPAWGILTQAILEIPTFETPHRNRTAEKRTSTSD